MKELNGINAQIQQRIQNRDPEDTSAASVYAECMKLKHAVTLAESQGSEVFKGYVAKLVAEGMNAGGSKASQRLIRIRSFAGSLTRRLAGPPSASQTHNCSRPYPGADSKTTPTAGSSFLPRTRDTVQILVDYLSKNGIACERFVGQATKDAEKGLSQKKQIAALTRFREGEFRVLVATSVGEEGLDVPSTDMVIFYEAVPSGIRSIQRKGRTGRSAAGRVVVLVTKGTSDEVFR